MFYSILLAGGQSSRMGQDKAKLEIDNESLLIRAIELLKTIGSEKVLLSGFVEGHECIPDLIPKTGPLGGIYSSLSWLKDNTGLDNSLILLIPIDMPLLNEAALLNIVEVAERQEARCCHYQGEVFPCVLRASKEAYNYLHEAFSDNSESSGKRSMKQLMRFLNSQEVSAEEFPEKIFININQPEDWAAFSKL